MASKVAAVQVIAIKQSNQLKLSDTHQKEEPTCDPRKVQVHRDSCKLGKWELYGLARRLVIFVAAIVYLWLCTSACVGACEQAARHDSDDHVQIVAHGAVRW